MGDTIQAIFNSIVQDPRTLLGPILFFYIFDWNAGTVVWGFGLTLAHLAAFVFAILKPRWWTALIALVALWTWLFTGVVILGADC